MRKIIKGNVTIIMNKKDYYSIKEKTILIAKNTHPDLVIVKNRIEAIVTEMDNKLCHAAIIAREFKIPLLMGIKNATKRFKTNDKVIIDLKNKSIFKIK